MVSQHLSMYVHVPSRADHTPRCRQLGVSLDLLWSGDDDRSPVGHDLGHPLLLPHVGRIETEAYHGVAAECLCVFGHPVYCHPTSLLEYLGELLTSPLPTTLMNPANPLEKPVERAMTPVVIQRARLRASLSFVQLG